MAFPSFSEVLTQALPGIIQVGSELIGSLLDGDDQERVSGGPPPVVRTPPVVPGPTTQVVNVPGLPATAGAGRPDSFLDCVLQGRGLIDCGLEAGRRALTPGGSMPVPGTGAAGAPAGTVMATAGGGACIMPQVRMPGVRFPSTVQFLASDANGNQRCVTYKNMGRPLLFSGDVAAARRVDRVARKARRASRKR